METTPLELYETAYRLHYNENRLPDAICYYKKLIKEFPDSNECGYAAIQLQKIKAHNVAETLHTLPEKKHTTYDATLPLSLAAMIIALIALVVVFNSTRTLQEKIENEKMRTSLAINALGKVSRGELDEALVLLGKMKTLDSSDIFPYEISADIYRKQKKYQESRNEYLTFFTNNPDRKPTGSEEKFSSFNEQKTVKKTPSNLSSQKRSISRQTKKTVTRRRPVRRKVKRVRKKQSTKKTPPPPPNRTTPKKGLFLVDPDSISYF